MNEDGYPGLSALRDTLPVGRKPISGKQMLQGADARDLSIG